MRPLIGKCRLDTDAWLVYDTRLVYDTPLDSETSFNRQLVLSCPKIGKFCVHTSLGIIHACTKAPHEIVVVKSSAIPTQVVDLASVELRVACDVFPFMTSSQSCVLWQRYTFMYTSVK